MRFAEHKSLLNKAGTVGADLGSERPEAGLGLQVFGNKVRVVRRKNFGLGAVERSKANSEIQANESALDRLIVYSGPTLLGTQAGSKCLVERLAAMPPPP